MYFFPLVRNEIFYLSHQGTIKFPVGKPRRGNSVPPRIGNIRLRTECWV
jgi:hypothetical protein